MIHNEYVTMLKRMRAEILALKTNRLRTASSIAVDSYSQNVNLAWQYYNTQLDEYAFLYYNIYADLANTNPAFAMILLSGLESLFNMSVGTSTSFKPPLSDGVVLQSTRVVTTDSGIINRLKNGETVNFNTTITVTATEEVTGIRLEQLPWPQ